MHNIKKKNLAILLEFGFHEIKKYIHSGFAQKLSEHFDIIWLAIDKGNKEFDNYFKSTGFPVVYFSSQDFQQSESKTEANNHSVRRHWMIRKHLGAFHNYSKVRKKTLKSTIIGSDLIKKIFESRTLRLSKARYGNKFFEQTFKQYRIDHLLATGYASVFAKSSFITASELEIKTWYLVNSWKDLYINNFIPFDFLTGMFVWSEQMKHDYLFHMPYLNKEKICVSGNPTFDILKKSGPAHSRSYYSSKYNIPEQADWLLYTMMPPGLINDEIETITLVANDILKYYNPQEKIIVIRRNPNHSTDEFNNMGVPSNTVFADHYCTFDKKNDMIVQSQEGEQEWIDLLHHCALNLSVPSTVTLEFLTLNKPVINIGFGPDGMPEERVIQHFEAGFYKPLFKNESVKKVERLGDLITALNDCQKIMPKAENNAGQQEAADIIIQRLIEGETI